MAVIAFLMVICAIIFGVAAGVTILAGASALAPRTNRELRTVRYQLKSARKTLYGIANDTVGNPALEAQIVLEDIDRKELEA